MSAVGAAALPKAGPGRFWKIDHNPKNISKPLHVELREYHSGNITQNAKFSRLIGQGNTTANEVAVRECADGILNRASRVDEFVGTYTEEKKAS